MKLQTLKPRAQAARILVKAAPTVDPSTWRADMTSSQRGYSYKWQQARLGYLEKHPYCVMCLAAAGITTTDQDEQLLQCLAKGIMPRATVVDHKVPHRGDMKLFWSTTNWQALCATHHSRDKQREESKLPKY